MFYSRLALTNLKKNGKTYIPYILTCVLTVMMLYVMSAIMMNQGLEKLPGVASLKAILLWAAIVTGLFSVIFLFYTNSFLVKQRKKEFGLYQVLGMDKKNLAKMMAWETVLTAVGSIFTGLLMGILFGKLMFLILLKMMHFSVPLKFAVEPQAILVTLFVFLAIFTVTLLFNLLQVQTANPVELLYGGNQGEKEPKTKWVLALIGIATLGTGYYIAQTTDSPLSAIGKFFIAVVLVIIGTYALFTAGSIALLKLLKAKKNFYYQTRHFTSISGMIYRMKQNAVGLANICIMSTVVLVLISATISLYAGMEDVLNIQFPTDFKLTVHNAGEAETARADQIIEEESRKAGVQPTDKISYRSGGFVSIFNKEESKMVLDSAHLTDTKDIGDYCTLEMIPLSDYNQIEGKEIVLEKGQLLVYTSGDEFDSDILYLEEQPYEVKQVVKEMKIQENTTANVMMSVCLVVPDIDVVRQYLEQYGNIGNIEDGLNMTYVDMFNLKGDEKAAEAAMAAMRESFSGEIPSSQVEYRQEASQEYYAMYGGFLFLGVFIGALFLMATVLIIYYKQISEGYDDRDRYQIMQKVGMSRKEVKTSIRSQVLTIFFLPLVMAVIHVAVAFKVLTKLLAIMGLVNVQLFLLCTIGTVVIFAVFYGIVFVITSREYYKIVQ